MSLERPCGGKHSLELHTCHNIRVPSISVLTLTACIKLLESWRQKHRSDMKSDSLFLHKMVDCMLLACLNTLITLGTQGTVKASLGLGNSLFFRKSFLDLDKTRQSTRRFQFMCPDS